MGNTNSQVIVNLTDFLSFLKEHELKVTQRVDGGTIQSHIDKLAALSADEKITAENSKELVELSKKIDPTLDAELQLREAYILTEKQFPLPTLLDHIDRLFWKDVFAFLPLPIQDDFREAGKCIAFERPTAAAFHILRATEGALRIYYRALVKRGFDNEATWGKMVTELRTRKRASRILLDSLDNIRNNFRNPTMHPEYSYGIDEVQGLLPLCADSVNRISAELKKLSH